MFHMPFRSPTIRITKEFHFEMAHALSDHEGPCKHIHGHSYVLQVTVSGKPNTEQGNPANGMVIDFTSLKSLVHENIIAHFDHTLVLNESDKKRFPDLRNEEKVIYLPFAPTCEMLLIHFTEIIAKHLPANVNLQTTRLIETATSYAEWHAEENL